MKPFPTDPLAVGGLAAFGRGLRDGSITSEAATHAYLGRIKMLDSRLGAFEHVAEEKALAQARALDRLLAAGTDLGPLMGVPVAIKDLFAVEGMPATAGSKVDVADLIWPEGSFVKALKRAGCVVLGKTKTVEFALGGTGVNEVRGTPWNPWDAKVHRTPGGSSSGSAVAMAAGMCAFAIGSDTGGSVRGPAAVCGVFGLKTTAGLWPTDGVFPLSPTLDTIGPLTRTAADAAVIFAALTGEPVPEPAAPRGVRLGRPRNFFFDDMEPEVAACSEAALRALTQAGVEIVEVDVPYTDVVSREAPAISSTELIAVLGRERFLAQRHHMDRTVSARAALGLEVKADTYLGMLWQHREMCRDIDARLEGVDGWVTPTRTFLPPPVAGLLDPKAGVKDATKTARSTRAANLFGLCASSSPIHGLGSTLPVGLQLMCRGHHEGRLLAVARMIEGIVGAPPRPDLTPFL